LECCSDSDQVVDIGSSKTSNKLISIWYWQDAWPWETNVALPAFSW
jgi:hypothetical protein